MRVVAIATIANVIVPPQKPACENTYGRPSRPAPITVPTIKAIAVNCGRNEFFVFFLTFAINSKAFNQYINLFK